MRTADARSVDRAIDLGVGEMHKHWACAMGHTVHGDSDDELVRKAQEHMKKEHGMDISREEVLKASKAGEH